MINGSLLCGQIRRGLLSIRFLLVLVLAVVIAIFQWWTIRHAGYRLPYHQPTFLDETLLFSSYGSGTTLYQFLFPFLAALAGGSTLAVERRSGRLTFLQARSSYGVVERTSLCSGFLLGALGGVLPYVIDVLLAAGGKSPFVVYRWRGEFGCRYCELPIHSDFREWMGLSDLSVQPGAVHCRRRTANGGTVRIVCMLGCCDFAVRKASERGSARAGCLPAVVVDASGDNPAFLHIKPC